MIELVFVIVILGILASVAVPRLMATREDAEIASAIANIRTLISDANSFIIAKGRLDINTRWNEITNVPLKNDDKQDVFLIVPDEFNKLNDVISLMDYKDENKIILELSTNKAQKLTNKEILETIVKY